MSLDGSHEAEDVRQVHLVVLALVQNLVDECLRVVQHLLVRDLVNMLDCGLLSGNLELVHELLTIEQTLQVPEGVIGLRLSGASNDSSFAASNHAPVVVQQCSGDVPA